MTKYRVYNAPDGCDIAFCGEYDTYDQAVAVAEREPSGTPKCLWATGLAANDARLSGPEGGEEQDEPISWHGANGWHCVCEVEFASTIE
jgi:hypothetical protein